jgi:carbamate kinase
MGISRHVATVVTQTEVSSNDPAFQNPTKPIGSFMSEEEAAARRAQDGWSVAEDAGRGWRRVVASPLPIRIVELEAIQTLLRAGIIVITVGGGGIPVVAGEKGDLQGVAAVIDKDYASALLATNVGAELFVISTAVPQVCLYYGTPDQTFLDHISLAEAQQYLAEGCHFAKGSMAPKVQAVVNFLEAGGRRAIITNPENLALALEGKAGTHFTAG